MAKKKGGKGPSKRFGSGGRTEDGATAKPNPFEQLYSRKKFDILGKRQKGVGKSAAQARQAGNEKVCAPLWHACGRRPSLTPSSLHAIARTTRQYGPDAAKSVVTQRKSTLLVEYQQTRKANNFNDRRFGGASLGSCSVLCAEALRSTPVWE